MLDNTKAVDFLVNVAPVPPVHQPRLMSHDRSLAPGSAQPVRIQCLVPSSLDSRERLPSAVVFISPVRFTVIICIETISSACKSYAVSSQPMPKKLNAPIFCHDASNPPPSLRYKPLPKYGIHSAVTPPYHTRTPRCHHHLKQFVGELPAPPASARPFLPSFVCTARRRTGRTARQRLA